MNDITKNEMLFVLNIFKSPEKEYNANNMAEHLGISSMGALKIARRLEEENILISRQIGKAKI
jgi:DNA-binding MarR family transcriptional regulator